jgi:hypothetical protein
MGIALVEANSRKLRKPSDLAILLNQSFRDADHPQGTKLTPATIAKTAATAASF